MEKITVEKDQSFFNLAKRIKTSKSPDIQVLFKKKAGIYRNALNLKILKSIAEEKGKSIKFEAENPKHKDFIDNINEGYTEYSENQVEIGAGTKFSRAGLDGSTRGRSIPIKPVLIILLSLGVLLGILFALWWYIPGATVKMKVDSKGLIKLLDVKAVSGGTVSKENSEIPAFAVEAEGSDAQSTPTTGKKETGEKAEGEITLYNKTSTDTNIKKGVAVTLITTDGEALKYEISESVVVPALTEETTTDTEPVGETVNKVYGKKEVKITAKAFGKEYNLDKEQKFEIDGYNTDEMVGENSEKITGGSLEELNIVSQTDLDALTRILTDSTREKAKEALYKKIVDGQKLPEASINFEIFCLDFSSKVKFFSLSPSPPFAL